MTAIERWCQRNGFKIDNVPETHICRDDLNGVEIEIMNEHGEMPFSMTRAAVIQVVKDGDPVATIWLKKGLNGVNFQ